MNFTWAKAGRFLVVLALLVSIGAHWALLRSVAWTQMLVERTQQSSFSEAVKTTFGGSHPCEMCLKIEEQQQKERQHRAPMAQKLKLDVILVIREDTAHPPQCAYQYPETNCSAGARSEPPILQPPRQV